MLVGSTSSKGECFLVREVNSTLKPVDFRSLCRISNNLRRSPLAVVVSAELKVFFRMSLFRKTSLTFKLARSLPSHEALELEKLNPLQVFDQNSMFRVIPLFCTAPSTAQNIATSKMAAVLPVSTKRTNKRRFYRAKAFIHNNNAADPLTASWKMKEMCMITKCAVVFHFVAVELWNYLKKCPG